MDDILVRSIMVLIVIDVLSSTPNCCHVNIIIFLVFHYFKFSIFYSLYLLTFYFYSLLYTLKVVNFITTIILLFTYEMSFTDVSDIFVVIFGVVRVEFNWSNFFIYLTLFYHLVNFIRFKILFSISFVHSLLNFIKLVLVNFYGLVLFTFSTNVINDWILLFISFYWL